MRVAGAGRLAMVAAVLVLLGSGCTPDPGPQPTPSPVAPTPTENAQEREQRLAYEAAEKSYRTYRAELQRVLRAGGATTPTELMRKTAGGQYLEETSAVAEAYKGLGHRDAGSERIVYVRRSGYSSSSLVLSVCEDSRQVTTLDQQGHKLYRGELRTAELTVEKKSTEWKVWAGTGKEVAVCD